MPKKQFDVPTLLLVEHGSTEYTSDDESKDRIHGTKFDLPLTWEGHRQSADVAKKLSVFDIGSLRTSPQQRAKETADHISQATGQTPEVDEGLKPLDSGYLSGMTHEAAKRRIEYYVKNPDKQIPQGQSYGEWWDTASTRMAKRLKEVAADPDKGHVDVLHSSEIASMPAIVRGESPSVWTSRQIPGPGRISAVEKHGGRWKFVEDWNGK